MLNFVLILASMALSIDVSYVQGKLHYDSINGYSNDEPLTLTITNIPDSLYQKVSYSICDAQILYIIDSTLQKIDNWIGSMPELIDMHCHCPKILYISDEIVKCKKLEVLAFYRPAFDAIPAVFFRIKSLAAIVIEHSHIKSIPDDISKLKKLELLDIQDSDVDSVTSLLWKNRKLKKIIIKKSKLTEFPNRIDKLKQLRWLDLSYNQIDSIPNETRFKSLYYFDMMENNLARIPKQLFVGCENIDYINIASNRIGHLEMEFHKKVKRSINLALGNNLFSNDVLYIEVQKFMRGEIEVIDVKQ